MAGNKLIKVKKLKRYCWKCGEVMKQERYDFHYDTRTGKKGYSISWICPNKRWFLDRHAKWRSNEHGDTYAYEA